MVLNVGRFIIFVSCLVMTAACSDDASSNCTGNLCPFVGNWELIDVDVDGMNSLGDYSGYTLNLYAPEGENISADYERHFGNGVEEGGTWTITNNDDVLVLTTHNEETEHIVEEVTQNSLVLILHRHSTKSGPEVIRYVFER